MARKSLRVFPAQPTVWQRLVVRILLTLAAILLSSVALELWIGGPSFAELLVALLLVGILVVELWRSGLLSGRSPGELRAGTRSHEAGTAHPVEELSATIDLALRGSPFGRIDFERRLAELLADRVAASKGMTRKALRTIRYDRSALSALVPDPELVELLWLERSLEERPAPRSDRLELASRWLRLLTKVEGYF